MFFEFISATKFLWKPFNWTNAVSLQPSRRVTEQATMLYSVRVCVCLPCPLSSLSHSSVDPDALPSVLANAHYDSAYGSQGAADCAACVGQWMDEGLNYSVVLPCNDVTE